ncbi:MAG: pilin [Burkholderiaceae bacterium]|nr:pilin [Burkholderiaceae bacterium]
MKRVQQGFTLIELMIVIAIIGILAAVALPAYRDYTVRAKTSEMIAAASNTKAAVSEFVTVNAALPSSTQVVVEASTAGIISAVAWDGAKITVTAKNADPAPTEIRNMKIELRATMSGSQVVWVCGPAATDGVPIKYLPSSCTTAAAATGT